MKKFLVTLLIVCFCLVLPASTFSYSNTKFAPFYVLEDENNQLLAYTMYSNGTYGLFKLDYGLGCGVVSKNGQQVFVEYSTFLDGGISNKLYTKQAYQENYDMCTLWKTEEIMQFQNLTWVKN